MSYEEVKGIFYILRPCARNLRRLNDRQLEIIIKHFFAGIVTETDNKPVNENLNYTATRLYEMAVSRSLSGPYNVLKLCNFNFDQFRNYLNDNIYIRGKEGIADLLYGKYRGNAIAVNSVNDLGNRLGTNDHINYIGRGYIQLTGRKMYIATYNYGKALMRYSLNKNDRCYDYLSRVIMQNNIVDKPNLMLVPNISLCYSILYFINYDYLIRKALNGESDKVRIAMNGGRIGLTRYMHNLNKLV